MDIKNNKSSELIHITSYNDHEYKGLYYSIEFDKYYLHYGHYIKTLPFHLNAHGARVILVNDVDNEPTIIPTYKLEQDIMYRYITGQKT